jgi:PAS domain S-box-containing protein
MRRVEDRLKRSRERLTGLFEEVPCYLSVQGRDLVIQHANRAFRETFGDAVGEHCYQVYKHRDEPCLVCPALQAFDDGESREHEEVVTSSSGRKINVLSTTAPIRGADGEVTSVIEMSTDITQLRQLQSQLESIGLLVGSISHGIKGLLTGLDGGMYLVNTGFAKEDTARVEKGWEMVQRNVARIRSMVQDILYYAKDRDLEVVGVDATVLGRDIAQILEKKARDFDVTLEVQIADDLGIFEGDAQAFRATLLNLLENSLEACRSDRNKTGHHVRFSVWRDEPWMCFEIEDDGVGMDRETKDKIFSLFFTSKGIRGTGLGLFIANKIVEKHGGTIDVRSEPGHGSRFRVRVPLEARPSTRPPEVSQAGDEN